MLTTINCATGQEISYDYEEIYEMMKGVDRNLFFKRLYEKSKSGEIQAVCTCVKNKKIPLVISKRGDTYYIKRQDVLEQHSSSCKFDGEYLHSIKGWDMQKDGSINVSLKDKPYSAKKFNSMNIKNQITLSEFITKYMGWVWELQTKYCYKNKRALSLDEYMKGLQYWAEKVHLSERVTLKHLIGKTKSKAYALLQEKLRMFVLLPLKDIDKSSVNEYKLFLEEPSMNYALEVTCSKNLWENNLRELNEDKPLMIGGFVEMVKDKPLNFFVLSACPISNEGVVIRSEYERELINDLHKKGRSFVNSFETYQIFEEYVPDLMLLDTSPRTLVEIYSKASYSKKHRDEKQKKIEYFLNQHKYKIITWNPYENKTLPNI